MLSDDVYRAKLQATIAALKYWMPQIKDVARIEEVNAPEYWKITVAPHTKNACPFELMLRADQKYDLMISGEAFEDRVVDNLDLFVPLVEAIADGNVVQRLFLSQMTGIVHVIETIVLLPGNKTWRGKRVAVEAPGISSYEVHVRQFLAYRRSAA